MTPRPSIRLAGAAIVGFALGVVLGSYHRPWSFTMLSGLVVAAGCALAMLVKLAGEARHRRTHHCVVRKPPSNIVAIRREQSA